MHRLFVAFRPPRAIREHLLSLMGGVSGVRWQTDEQLHVTLRFIGAVDGGTADDVAMALSSVRHPRLTIGLTGLGTFQQRREPSVLWAGVGPPDPLIALHKKVDQACVRAGLEPERRAYRPHITLARLKPSSGSIEHLLKSWVNLSGPSLEVDRFALYKSTLTPEGAVYSVAQSYPLE